MPSSRQSREAFLESSDEYESDKIYPESEGENLVEDSSEPDESLTSAARVDPPTPRKKRSLPTSGDHSVKKRPRISHSPAMNREGSRKASTPGNTPSGISSSRSNVIKKLNSGSGLGFSDSGTSANLDRVDGNVQQGQNHEAVLEALGEITNTLGEVLYRLNKQDSRMDSLEQKVAKEVEKVVEQRLEQSKLPATPSSSCCSDTPKKAIKSIVRLETRRMYNALLAESDTFTGFVKNNGETFKDKKNKAVVDILVKEVRAANPSFQAADIRAAAYTYYRSKSQENSLKSRGLLEDRNKARRRRERIIRKLQDRSSVLEKSSLSERDKGKWRPLMSTECMSSEESDPDDTESLIKHELTWRADKVANFFYELDKLLEKQRSGQGKRQRKTRIFGNEVSSSRPIQSKKFPSWACKTNTVHQ